MIATGGTAALASPFSTGESERNVVVAGTVIEVHAYKPAGYRGGPLLVSFHGLSRNVGRYLGAAKPVAAPGSRRTAFHGSAHGRTGSDPVRLRLR